MVKMNNVDWPAIGAAVNAGAKSIRKIAREYGVSHTAIQKRAEKGDWEPHSAVETTQADPDSLRGGMLRGGMLRGQGEPPVEGAEPDEVAKPATADAVATSAASYGLDMVSATGKVSESVSVEATTAEAAATGKVRTETPSVAGAADNGKYGVQFIPEARSINVEGATTTGNPAARWRYGAVTGDDCLIWTELHWKPDARQWQPGPG